MPKDKNTYHEDRDDAIEETRRKARDSISNTEGVLVAVLLIVAIWFGFLLYFAELRMF